jgi:hypothetical protein
MTIADDWPSQNPGEPVSLISRRLKSRHEIREREQQQSPAIARNSEDRDERDTDGRGGEERLEDAGWRCAGEMRGKQGRYALGGVTKSCVLDRIMPVEFVMMETDH